MHVKGIGFEMIHTKCSVKFSYSCKKNNIVFLFVVNRLVISSPAPSDTGFGLATLVWRNKSAIGFEETGPSLRCRIWLQSSWEAAGSIWALSVLTATGIPSRLFSVTSYWHFQFQPCSVFESPSFLQEVMVDGNMNLSNSLSHTIYQLSISYNTPRNK